MASATTISFTTSNRGKPLLVFSGFVYRLTKSMKSVEYWDYHSDGSPANIHADLNDRFRKANDHHRHVPAPERIELRDLKNKVKDRALTESNAMPKIYEEKLARSINSLLLL